MSLLPEVREVSAFGRWEPVSQVPEERWLFLTQKSCQIQEEFMSSYPYSLRPNKGAPARGSQEADRSRFLAFPRG